MIVVTYYQQFRIEVVPIFMDGAWDADISIRRTLSDERAQAEHVNCRKATAIEAAERGQVCARRWIDSREHRPIREK
jgi:hypothetical protein